MAPGILIQASGWGNKSHEHVEYRFTSTLQNTHMFVAFTQMSQEVQIVLHTNYRSGVDQLLQIMDAVKEWATLPRKTRWCLNATLTWHDHLHAHHATKPSLYSTLLMHNHLGHEVAFCDWARGWLPKTLIHSLCRPQSRLVISTIRKVHMGGRWNNYVQLSPSQGFQSSQEFPSAFFWSLTWLTFSSALQEHLFSQSMHF